MTKWTGVAAWLAEHALVGAAAICLLVSVVLAIEDRVAAGTLAAGLFVILVLFHYLPQMESFKAYGIEAKWRERLREADDLLRKLRQSALASAQLTYDTLGWGSRMGGHRYQQKQKLAEQVDAVLVDLGVSNQEISVLKQDYLFFAAFDLYQLFAFVVNKALHKRRVDTIAELNNLGPNVESQASTLRERLTRLDHASRVTDVLAKLRQTDFRSACGERIPDGLLGSEDTAKLRELTDRLSNLIEEGYRSGRVVPEAAELLDGPLAEVRSTLYRRLFGEDPLP